MKRISEGYWKNSDQLLKSGSWMQWNGYEIFVNVVGEGEPLVLLHGYPFNSYDYNRLLPYLLPKYKVYLFDFLGMGFSDKPKNIEYTFELYVDLLCAVLHFFSLNRFSLFAHDLACSVVQELIASAKANLFKISSIVFSNGGLFSDVYKPRLIQRLLSQSPDLIGHTLNKLLSRNKIETSVYRLFGSDTKPSPFEKEEFWKILNCKEGKQIAYKIGRMVFQKPSYQSRWNKALLSTSIPFCYLCGPSDPNSGTHMAIRFRKEFPNAPVYLMPENIGHWPQWEDPKNTFAFLETFQNGVVNP